MNIWWVLTIIAVAALIWVLWAGTGRERADERGRARLGGRNGGGGQNGRDNRGGGDNASISLFSADGRADRSGDQGDRNDREARGGQEKRDPVEAVKDIDPKNRGGR